MVGSVWPRAGNLFFIGAAAATGLLLGDFLMLIILLILKNYQWPEAWLDRPRDSHRGLRFGLLLALVFLVAGLGSLYTTFYFNYFSQVELKSMSANAVLSGAFGISYLVGILLGGILSDLCNWLVERSSKKPFGRPAVLIFGLLVSCLELILMLLWASPDTTAVSSLTRVILIGAGLGLSLPALIALLVEQFPHYRWGLIAAIYMAVTMLGGTGMQALASAFLSASGYRASSSSQAASVHSLLTSTWSVLSLILTGVALTVGVFIFALRRKPLEQPYPEPGEGMC